jgi:hypothetical protein
MRFDVRFPDGTVSPPMEARDEADALQQRQRLLENWRAARPDDALGAALEGVTGGWLDEASGGIGALISAMGGGTLKEGYKRGYEGSKGRREGFARRNPKTSTALELGGNVASFALTPEIKAAQALGIGGRLAPRLVNAAATGATYGALGGAGYAESPEGPDSSPSDVAGATVGGALAGGALGGAVGGAAEGAVSAIGAGLRGIRRGVGATTRPEVEAEIGRNIRRESGQTPDELVARMQQLQEGGYDPVVGDMGGVRTRRMARAAADVSPEAEATLTGVTRPRYQGQVPRAEAAIERASGGVGEETRFGLQDRIRAAERERGALYDEAYLRGDEGISWSPELADLARPVDQGGDPLFRSAMREGAERLRNNNNAARARGQRQWDHVGRAPGPARGIGDNSGSGAGPRATLAYWDQVKRALDRMISHAGTNEAGRHTEAARALDMMRRTLVEHLTNEVPAYQRALGVSHQLFGGREAGQIGEEMFDANMPGVEIRRVMAELTPSERRLAQMSWISKMVTAIRKKGDTQDITKQIAQSSHARDQLQAIFGREGAAQLLRHRDIEQGLNLLHNEVSGNSKTARYLIGAAGGGLLGAGISGGNILSPSSWPQIAMGAVAGMGVARAQRALATRLNERAAAWIAEALASRDPELLRRVAVAGERDPAIRDAVSRLGRAAAGATVGGFNQATQ